jgi:hypothetical protein
MQGEIFIAPVFQLHTIFINVKSDIHLLKVAGPAPPVRLVRFWPTTFSIGKVLLNQLTLHHGCRI